MQFAYGRLAIFRCFVILGRWCFELHYGTVLGRCRLLLGRLSKGFSERRTSTESDAFSFIIWLDAAKFVLLSVFILIDTIWPKIQAKPLPINGKGPLSVDARRSKTSLLKLPIGYCHVAQETGWKLVSQNGPIMQFDAAPTTQREHSLTTWRDLVCIN